jgi:hypothetical protein
MLERRITKSYPTLYGVREDVNSRCTTLWSIDHGVGTNLHNVKDGMYNGPPKGDAYDTIRAYAVLL